MTTRSHAISDAEVLRQIERLIRSHITAAMLEASALCMTELKSLDPDAVMQSLRHEFRDDGQLADALSDALFNHKRDLDFRAGVHVTEGRV